MTTAVKRARKVKRYRSTKEEIEAFRELVCRIVEEQHPLDARSVYYAVADRLGDKSPYLEDKTQRALDKLRADGTIPYEWITDESRDYMVRRSYSSIADALEHIKRTYCRNVWDGLDCTVQVWVEKRGMAWLFEEICFDLDVPVFPAAGYTSHAFAIEAGKLVDDRPVYIYYFGDFDPSGMDAPRALEVKIAKHFPGDTEVHFRHVALHPEQVIGWNLSTRDANDKDMRFKGFATRYGTAACDLNAVPNDTLRDLARETIYAHFPEGHLERRLQEQREDRHRLAKIIDSMRGEVDE